MIVLALRLQGKYTEADPLYVRAIEIREGVLGADHPDLAISLGTRGQLLKAQVRVIVPPILAPVFIPFCVNRDVSAGVTQKFVFLFHCPTVCICGSGLFGF